MKLLERWLLNNGDLFCLDEYQNAVEQARYNAFAAKADGRINYQYVAGLFILLSVLVTLLLFFNVTFYGIPSNYLTLSIMIAVNVFVAYVGFSTLKTVLFVYFIKPEFLKLHIERASNARS